MILFQSDYLEGAHPLILERLVQTNMEQTSGYGADDYCKSAADKIRSLCQVDTADVHFMVGGTQSNLTVIGALLRRAKIASNRKLEVGNFVMDADEHTAYLNEEEILLTNREFSILYKLLSYPKKTFTRTQLMDEFWDADTETAPRAVDVYMTKLRAKLSRCNDFEIVTVHGLGYKAVVK